MGIPSENELTGIEQPQEEVIPTDQNTPDWMQAVQPAVKPMQNSEGEELPETGLPVWMALDEQIEEEKLEFPDQKSLASEAKQASQSYQPTILYL